MKNKPDDRRDNVEKIQKNIDNTYRNIAEAEKTMAITDNEKTKEEIRAKNERRREAIKGMIEEIKDEAKAKKEGYKM